MTVDDLLYLLSLSGPFLSVSRVVGKERAQRLEKALLSLLTRLWKLLPMLLKLAVVLLLLFAFIAAPALISLYFPPVIAVFSGIATLIFFVPYTNWQGRMAHAVIVNVCTDWERNLGTAPPWPFATVGGPYKLHYIMWTTNALPFLIAFYSFLLPCAVLVSMAILAPFQLANWVRSKLTPENPSYFDILGWAISAFAVLAGMYKRIMVVEA